MRIAILVGAFPTVSETFVLNQVTGLIDRGHDVHIFATRSGQTNAMHGDIARYNLLSRVHHSKRDPGHRWMRPVSALPLVGRTVLHRPSDAAMLTRIARIGGASASYRLLHDAELFRRTSPFDVLLCHFGHNGLRGAYLKEAGVSLAPLVTFFHGADVSRFLKNAGPHVYDQLFKIGDLFLPISGYWRDCLSSLGCPENKTFVHRMGIDCRKFIFRQRVREANEALRVISVARLIEKKGLEYSINAVADVIEAGVKVDYTIVGEGPLRQSLEALIRHRRAGTYIHLVGQCSQDEVISALDRAHVMVAPSVTASNGDMEGIPVALMEAMASGLIVLSTRHSGIPELIEDGVTGYLVPERDSTALAGKLRLVATSDDSWSDITTAARGFIVEQHDIEKLNDRLVYQLEALLNGQQASVIS